MFTYQSGLLKGAALSSPTGGLIVEVSSSPLTKEDRLLLPYLPLSMLCLLLL